MMGVAKWTTACLAVLALTGTDGALAQTDVVPLRAVTARSFADLTALALAAPIVVRATLTKAERLRPRDASDVAAGMARLLVTAATTTAIAAPDTVPPRLSLLTDVSLDAKGRPPKLTGDDVLLFVRPGASAGEVALVAAQAIVAWTPAADATVRAVLTAARRNGLGGDDPIVTGVTSAFRVPGSVPGEAESQFFLATQGGKPVSLVVLTRPGAARRLTIATGDVIDDAAQPVVKDTLLWYRLACGLPPRLPPSLAAPGEVADDYRFVLSSLGPCGRTF